MISNAVPVAALLALLAAPLTAQAPPPTVRTEMRRVDFHVDSTLVMQIALLRGNLTPLRAGTPVTFDDPGSFAITIDSAEITLTMTALSDLLNRYVFHYPGSPLRGLHAEAQGTQLKQSGRLHGLPFSVVTELHVMPDGELRLHPVSIHVLGIGAQGLMHTFGLTLQKMANVKNAPGVRIDTNDLVLRPATMLPPPVTRGTLVAAAVHDSSLTLWFSSRHVPPSPVIPNGGHGNFMYFSGSTIRFGHLTMTPADLLVVDRDPKNPFDFWLARYAMQLVAGVSHTTTVGGLITEWPDWRSMRR